LDWIWISIYVIIVDWIGLDLENLTHDQLWVVQGQSFRLGVRGAKPPEAGKVFVFKTLIFSTFSGSFHQINKTSTSFLCFGLFNE